MPTSERFHSRRHCFYVFNFLGVPLPANQRDCAATPDLSYTPTLIFRLASLMTFSLVPHRLSFTGVIEEEFYDSATSSEVGPLMEDPETPTKTSAHELEELQNESRTTVAQGSPSSSPSQFESSPLPPSPNPPSRRSLPSGRSGSELRALRDEQAQEQARVDYLQGVGLELASTRRSADHEQPSPAPPADSSGDEALRRSLDSNRRGRGLQRLKLRRIERRAAEHDGPDVSTPSPASLNSKTSFHARRTREGANWFAGSRASKTLPPGFQPPEGLAESVPSPLRSLRGSSSRSASLRIRNDRLPPGYIQPHEQPLIVASASVPDREVVGETLATGHRLSLLPSLDASPERRTAVPLIPDLDEEIDQCMPAVPAPLIIPRRPPPDLTIDTTMSGALPASGKLSNRESRFSEVMEEVDDGARPGLPPKSPDRPSGRDSALLSTRGSVVFPVPEPPPEQEAPAAESNPKKPKSTPWVANGVLAALCAIAFALTVFGVSRFSPLGRHPAACTLEQVQTCAPPSLSFVHDLRLNTTLPEALQPYLPMIQPNDVQDLSLTDGGVTVTSPDDVSSYVRSALTMNTWLHEVNLLSDIRYAGVIGGDANSRESEKRLDELMDRSADGHDGGIAKFASAQGVSRDVSVSRDGGSVAQSFFALWLGCLLAVELSFVLYCAFALVRHCWLKSDAGVKREEKSWKQETSTALRLVLAGAVGTAAASGILVAFWT
jgi:hypothetical protein